MLCANDLCEYWNEKWHPNCGKPSLVSIKDCPNYIASSEADPNGIPAHEPGAKLDDGKLLAGILQQFALALIEVLKVGTFGTKKYSRGGWKEVLNGFERYSDAMMRHYLKEPLETVDPDSGLCHEAHLAWNALARLEFKLREERK